MTKRNEFSDVFKYINIGAPNECWHWTGPISRKGDPEFSVGGKKYQAYRVVKWLTDGNFNLQDQRVVVRHKCTDADGKPIDDRLCCNPNHSELGTHQQNTEDMMERGRSGLTKEAVYDIINLRKEHPELTHEQIASRIRFKYQCECSRQAVTEILNGRRRQFLVQKMKEQDANG